MPTNNQEEIQGKGFTVTDRRFSSKSEAEKEELLKEKEAETQSEESFSPPPQQESEKQDSRQPPEEVTFSGLIFSLSHSALAQMGEIPDPISNKKEKNLPLARQSIDLIALLQEKTKGNLNQEEDMLLTNVLYDLRMRFVQNSP